MRMVGVFRSFVREKMDSSGQGEIVELDLQQIVESASKLAQSLNDVQEDWRTGSVVGQAKSDIWRRFGELFEVFLSARRNTSKI